MKVTCKVEEYTFTVNVGQGFNDFAWLSLQVAKLYSNKKNPDSNYLPCFLQIKFHENELSFAPPPKEKIYEYKDSIDCQLTQNVILVDIIKGAQQQLSADQISWGEMAFGRKRNQFTTEFQLLFQTPKITNRAEPTVLVSLEYKMFPELSSEFNARDYPQSFKIPMVGTDMGNNLIKYMAEITLPFGHLTHTFCTQTKIDKADEESQKIITTLDTKNLNPQVRKSPKPVSQAEILKKIQDHALQQEQLLKELEQQEKEQLKDKQPGQLCPYKFQKLWTIIENNADGNLKLPELEDNLYQKIYEFMELQLPKLYEVFYQYTLLYDQDTEKKDEISISFQDIMHFLKFYGLVQDSSLLFDFVEYYDQEDVKSNDVKNSLKLSVKFPEFIVIIIKLADFRKTKNFIDVETQDQLIKLIVEKIISIDADESEFNNFQMHMKFNVTLINFLRENQKLFQNIYISRLSQSNETIDRKCHIRREEIKQLIQDSGYKGDNLDMIIETCYKELFNDDKYQGFEGLFYYEFLQVMQWLSLVLIQNDEREQIEENEEVGTMDELIEKLTYFMKCIEF